MRLLVALLLVLLLALQYRLWVGEGSIAELFGLQREVAGLQVELDGMRQRNEALRAEIEDLKSGREAIEERARNELGMILEGEVFYQVIEPTPQAMQ